MKKIAVVTATRAEYGLLSPVIKELRKLENDDFNVELTLNDEAKTTSAGTVQMVIDWLADKDGHVKAKNGHALGTGAYITKLWSKSTAKHRCDYKEQKKGDRTVKKDDTMKTFGYKRPQE